VPLSITKVARVHAAHDSFALEHWLALMLVPGLGPATANKLLQEFGSPEAILCAEFSRLRPFASEALCLDLRKARAAQASAVEQQLAFAEQHERHLRIFTLADADYPAALLQAPNPPPLLWAWGNAALLEQTTLAIVGSRSATQAGAMNAERFASSLGKAGLCIVSGLALGIDAAAHAGALHSHAGTIAVIGCGVDQIYPRRNRALYDAIAQQGLLLSEQPAGFTSRPAHFPQRNRIIAAISCATLVIEAARDSGSLITAKLALDMGKEVMAIPGSIHSPQSKGCHWLIKQGAKLVESAQDVLDELPGHLLPLLTPTGTSEKPAAGTAEPTHALLAHIGFDPTPLENIANGSALPASALQAELLGLELAARIERLSDGRYQRLV
jgi:DNA processing protein